MCCKGALHAYASALGWGSLIPSDSVREGFPMEVVLQLMEEHWALSRIICRGRAP